MANKTTRKIKPVAYKSAIRTVESYKKLRSKNVLMQSETIEQFERDISRFITKKGEIRKRISKKNLEKFNEIVSEFKKSKFSTISGLRKSTKKAEHTFTERHAGATTLDAKSVREMMTIANRNKVKIDSGTVVELALDNKIKNQVTNTEFMNIFTEYIERKDKLVPIEARSSLSEDDTVKNVKKIVNMYSSLNDREKNTFIHDIQNDYSIKELEQKYKKTKTSVSFKKGKLTVRKTTSSGILY